MRGQSHLFHHKLHPVLPFNCRCYVPIIVIQQLSALLLSSGLLILTTNSPPATTASVMPMMSKFIELISMLRAPVSFFRRGLEWMEWTGRTP